MNKKAKKTKGYNKTFFFLRPLIRWVYDFRCFLCSDISFAHDVHHVDHNHNNNNAENLLPVCRDCHNRIHKGFLLNVPFQTDKQKKLLIHLNQLAKEFARRSDW